MCIYHIIPYLSHILCLFLFISYIVYLIYFILFLVSCSLQVSYTFMFISFHVRILCMYHILSYLIYFHITYLIPISCLLSCSGYTPMLYYSFLTYCFIIYFLMRSCIVIYLHLLFHSDYRIGIHDRFEREPLPICHSIAM